MPDLLHSNDAIATAFVRAIVALDFDRLESALAPSIRFRALTPASCRKASTAEDARRMIEGWFEGSDLVEVVHLNVDDIADRLHLAYRLRVHDPGAWYVVEQQAFADIADSRFASLSILCSGFHPIEIPAGAGEPDGGTAWTPLPIRTHADPAERASGPRSRDTIGCRHMGPSRSVTNRS